MQVGLGKVEHPGIVFFNNKKQVILLGTNDSLIEQLYQHGKVVFKVRLYLLWLLYLKKKLININQVGVPKKIVLAALQFDLYHVRCLCAALKALGARYLLFLGF